MKRYLLLLGVIMLAGCEKTSVGDIFDPEIENEILVWGADENGDRFKCCWVEWEPDPSIRFYKVYEFFDDFTIIYHRRDKATNTIWSEPSEYSYTLEPGRIGSLLLYVNGEWEDSFFYYKFYSNKNILGLLNASIMDEFVWYERKPSKDYLIE